MRALALSIIGAAAIGSAALAQNQPSAPAPSSPPAMDCHPAPPPTGGTGEAPSGRGATGNPTNKLSQSGGVICPPPNVDRSIQKPAPEQGRTPVIRPPGSPGNSAPQQPK